MPDSVNVIAPMLLTYGSTEQKQYFLPRIQVSPASYTFQVQNNKSPGCLLDQDSGSLFLINDHGSVTSFGATGDATTMLAGSYSTLWLLYEKLLGLTHLRKVSEYWEEEYSTEVARIEIDILSLTAFFLKKTGKADKQIGLRVNRDRNNLYGSLFQSLGYYALLSPDATLGSNEPLPFRRNVNTCKPQGSR